MGTEILAHLKFKVRYQKRNIWKKDSKTCKENIEKFLQYNNINSSDLNNEKFE